MGKVIVAVLIGVALGAWGGHYLARQQTRFEILAGPYSDYYGPALAALGEAKVKLQAGNTNIATELQTAQEQIEKAQAWTRRFLDQ